jgi:hypothetical protein
MRESALRHEEIEEIDRAECQLGPAIARSMVDDRRREARSYTNCRNRTNGRPNQRAEEPTMVSLILWVIWAGWASAIIVIDHRLRVRRARARGAVDFSVGAPLQYLVLSLIASFLVLPIYFYATRRKWWALLEGVLATIVSGIAASLTVFAIALLFAPA